MRFGLLAKFSLTTIALMIGVMLLFAFVNMGMLKDMWLREAVRDVDNLSETIIRTTHYQMLEDDRSRVFAMINEVGAQEGIEHIRLINKDGRIIFSTEGAEVGSLLDKDAAACNVCHLDTITLAQASSMSRSRVFKDGNGEQILGLAKGIYNQARCSSAACHAHDSEAKLLGVLDVTVSLTGMNKRLALYRDALAVFTVVLLVVLFGCLTFLTRKLVSRPVNQLLMHTHKLARGELDGHVEATYRDELGELAEAFNEMTANLGQAHDKLQEWADTLELRVAERTREIQEIQRRLMHSEKLASLGELVAGIAHEVNNPLGGILMFSSLALKNPNLDPGLRDDLQIIVRETQRCADIVRGLLDFSRQSKPQKKMESVNRLLDMTLSLVEHQATFQNISISRNYNEHLPDILADPAQLRQVFMNLLLNAGQAMPDGGMLTTVTGMDSESGHLFIAISDTGCGIKQEHMSKIFDPFFTTKEHSGTGLGLSVSYGIVKSHGGNIEVQSREGEGTTFTIHLPLTPPVEELLPAN